MKVLRSLLLGLSVGLSCLALASPARADDLRRETVRFAPGASGSTIKARVKGYESVQYVLDVESGQKMRSSSSPPMRASISTSRDPGPMRRSTTARSTATPRR